VFCIVNLCCCCFVFCIVNLCCCCFVFVFCIVNLCCCCCFVFYIVNLCCCCFVFVFCIVNLCCCCFVCLYELSSLWFYSVGAQIHYLPHSTPAYGFCSKYTIWSHYIGTKNIITNITIKLEYNNRQKKVYGTKVILSNTMNEVLVTCLVYLMIQTLIWTIYHTQS
jgi:hypothetical protein